MGGMKTNGANKIFRLHDIRRYPIFYVELWYIFSTLLGTGLVLSREVGISQPVPPDTSPLWEAAASYAGVTALLLVAVGVCATGFYGLFWGGFKWRARHMMGQFVLRLYTVIGVLSVYGLYPASWLSNLSLCVIAGVLYLKLKWETARWEEVVRHARH